MWLLGAMLKATRIFECIIQIAYLAYYVILVVRPLLRQHGRYTATARRTQHDHPSTHPPTRSPTNQPTHAPAYPFFITRTMQCTTTHTPSDRKQRTSKNHRKTNKQNRTALEEQNKAALEAQKLKRWDPNHFSGLSELSGLRTSDPKGQ